MNILVKVKPGSIEQKIEKIDDKNYIAWLEKRAEKGKANTELIKLLASYFEVDKNKIVIKNPTSRKKIIEIDDKNI